MIRTFVDALPRMFVECYRHRLWVWHVLAALITAVCVFTGFDWWFFEHTRIDTLYPLILLAGIGGFFVPVLLAVLLYWAGEWQKNTKLIHLGVMVAQAEIIAITIIAVYKAFTGRIQPEFLTHYSMVDISHEFQFGLLRHGIFWGWPSSHTVVAVAAATVLFLAVRQPLLRVCIVGWAAVVAVGAAVGFHWFSDVVAGAMIGVSVGVTVFKFRK